jgi:hypothetical protein
MLPRMIEIEVITCPCCGTDALRGSFRILSEEQLGCLHCNKPFDFAKGVAIKVMKLPHASTSTQDSPRHKAWPIAA